MNKQERMTSKEKVKELYPDSRAEKYKTRDPLTNTYYYLIWDTYKLSERRRLGEG